MHGTSGLVAMTSASHAEGRQFDPGLVYISLLVLQDAAPFSRHLRTAQIGDPVLGDAPHHEFGRTPVAWLV